jgi:hypothetical protein
MNRKPLAYLADILESCEAIDSALFGLEEEDYLVNRLVRSSVEREFTIIGESVLALSRKAPDVFASITGAPRAVAARRSNSCGLSPPMSAIDSPAARLAAGERSLQSWLALVGRQAVPLPMEPLLSVNQPADLALFNRREFL